MVKTLGIDKNPSEREALRAARQLFAPEIEKAIRAVPQHERAKSAAAYRKLLDHLKNGGRYDDRHVRLLVSD